MKLLVVPQTASLSKVVGDIATAAAAKVSGAAECTAAAEPLDKKSFVTTVATGQTIVLVQDGSVPDSVTGDRFYHHRVFWVEGVSSIDEVVADIDAMINSPLQAEFVSTRGKGTPNATFLSVIREGLAPDGGLYMPRQLPKFSPSLMHYLSSVETDYRATAIAVLERLADKAQLPSGVLQDMVNKAYAKERWSGLDDLCPITKLRDGVHVIELFHGPTAAFKDFALQLFPQLFDLSTMGDDVQYMILAATSGDTGVAAISGFMNAAPDTRVMVLYPDHGVSPVQKVQMISCDGGAVRVFGVASDFDFCQTTVKHTFNDAKVAENLKKDHGLKLSSANSINWGRLVPQIVYYFHAYGDLVRNGVVKAGEEVDIAVPTGNFGNILSAYVGKLMGLPVRKFVVASNKNDVLADFVLTGKYDIRERPLVPTVSPSIDILKASNIERFLYFLSEGDTTLVASMMQSLNTEKFFELPAAMFDKMKGMFWAGRCDEETCHATIGSVWEATKDRIVDPHTAVGVKVIEQYEKELAAAGTEKRPILLAATAHWAKFPQPVLSGLTNGSADIKPAGDATGVAADIATVKAAFAAISDRTGGFAKVAPPLADALARAEGSSQSVVRTAPADEGAIQERLYGFVSGKEQ